MLEGGIFVCGRDVECVACVDALILYCCVYTVLMLILSTICTPTSPALSCVLNICQSPYLGIFRFLDIRKLLLYKSNHAKKVSESARQDSSFNEPLISLVVFSRILPICLNGASLSPLYRLLPSSQSERRCNAAVEQRGPQTLALVTTRDVRKGEVSSSVVFTCSRVTFRISFSPAKPLDPFCLRVCFFFFSLRFL